MVHNHNISTNTKQRKEEAKKQESGERERERAKSVPEGSEEAYWGNDEGPASSSWAFSRFAGEYWPAMEIEFGKGKGRERSKEEVGVKIVRYRLKRISYDLSNNAATCTRQSICYCVWLWHDDLFALFLFPSSSSALLVLLPTSPSGRALTYGTERWEDFDFNCAN